MYRTQAAGRRRRMPSPRSPVGVYQQPLQDENPVGKSGKSRERILLRQRLSRKWYQFRIPGATTKMDSTTSKSLWSSVIASPHRRFISFPWIHKCSVIFPAHTRWGLAAGDPQG